MSFTFRHDVLCVVGVVSHAKRFRRRKRISLVFRGSVTVKDFIVDADSYMCPLKNPLSESGETLGIHHGFYGKSTFILRRKGFVVKRSHYFADTGRILERNQVIPT